MTGALVSTLNAMMIVIPSSEVESRSADLPRLRPVTPDFPNRTALCPLNKAPVSTSPPSTSVGLPANAFRLSPLPL